MRPGARLKHGISIRRQLIIGVALVHLVVMSIFVLDLTHRQRTFLNESADERAQFQARLLATSSAPHIIMDDLAGLLEIVDAFSRDHTIRYAMVTDGRGQVLSHSDRSKIGQSLTDGRSLAILAGPQRSQFLFQSPRNVQAVAPIQVQGRTIGWAWLAIDRSGDQEHLNYVTKWGLLYTAIAVAIGGMFAILLANTITRPLRSLLLGAKRLSADRLDVPVPVRGTNEVGMVAQAFNAAMQRLAQQRVALQTEIMERGRAEEALKKANRSLARSNQDLEQFAYAASHDLQEPLRTIKNFTSLLERRYKHKLDDSAREFIEIIVDGAQRMESLIRDLLAYSRAGRAETPAGRVDTGHALLMALSNLRGAIESNAAIVTHADLPQVLANEVEMVQLFQNLIGNAIKYRGQATPRISVQAAKSDNQWVFEVHDNGLGIDQMHRERIFGVFQRLHGTEVPGSGIGLATCARIVERYGGRIWVEPETGVGSVFKFTMPEVRESEAMELANSASL